MKKNNNDLSSSDRRTFLKQSFAGTVAAASAISALSAKSYANIIGANDRIHMAAAGMHGRGRALVRAASMQKNVSMIALCDVDRRVFETGGKQIVEQFGSAPKNYEDYRGMMENKDIDAVLIATPEHWHAPMTIMGVQNDKHVYVEKPCSHNPHEGELLLKAQKKFSNYVIQMGNQQRSAPTSNEAIKKIREGLIGEPYMGKAWYANTREPIGRAKEAEVPDWLNWDLWQGPAPRESFKDIYVHYKWHWFWKYGTGEINNNGTHEIDVCRWALGVEYPEKVMSVGGRFHHDDDWQFYDTQTATFAYAGGKSIEWEGRSCNAQATYGRRRGAQVLGTKGSVILDRNHVTFYSLSNEKTLEFSEETQSATMDTVGVGGLDVLHMKNFVNAIRVGEKQNSPIAEGVITNNLCHLGNYAQASGATLNIDEKTGRITNNRKVMKKYWKRDYQKGWTPKV